MNIEDVASPCRWTDDNAGRSGGTIDIAGWDFGGEGELALLQHANGMSAALWAPVAVQLTARYHVIALDCRGHGDSERLNVPEDYDWPVMVSDIVQVAHIILRDSGSQDFALAMGSSFGGILLAGAAAAEPALFQRLIMLDPPIHATEDLLNQMGVEMPSAPANTRDRLVAQTLKRKDTWASREEARRAWQDKPLFSVWQDSAFSLYLNAGMRDLPDGRVQLKCHPSVEAHIFASTGSFGLFDYAPRVQIPVDLVHARDGHASAAFFQHIAEVFPNCTLSSMAAGHMLPLEAPDAVAAFALAQA